jgi:hypothetical protein
MAQQLLVGQGLLIIEASRSQIQTPGRTPLDEWSARSRDLYLETHKTCKRQTSIAPVGLEPTIPASERPQTDALDCTATGIGVPLRHADRRHTSISPSHVGVSLKSMHASDGLCLKALVFTLWWSFELWYNANWYVSVHVPEERTAFFFS